MMHPDKEKICFRKNSKPTCMERKPWHIKWEKQLQYYTAKMLYHYAIGIKMSTRM